MPWKDFNRDAVPSATRSSEPSILFGKNDRLTINSGAADLLGLRPDKRDVIFAYDDEKHLIGIRLPKNGDAPSMRLSTSDKRMKSYVGHAKTLKQWFAQNGIDMASLEGQRLPVVYRGGILIARLPKRESPQSAVLLQEES